MRSGLAEQTLEAGLQRRLGRHDAQMASGVGKYVPSGVMAHAWLAPTQAAKDNGVHGRFPPQILLGADGLRRFVSRSGLAPWDFTRLALPGQSAPRAPTGVELRHHPVVIAAIEQAWIDSKAATPQAHEEGGFIYLQNDGEVFVVRAAAGDGNTIDLSAAAWPQNAFLVGTFHTHPHRETSGARLGPSDADEAIAMRRGMPGLVRSFAGVHVHGPQQRASLSGHVAYPFFP